jgi:anti-anti-sigma factor
MSQVELIRVSASGTTRIVSFSSEHINRMETARQIGWQLNELLDSEVWSDAQEDSLNLDFKDIHWISSAGLNELIGINSMTRSQGVKLILLNVPDKVRDVFELTRLERMFEFSSSAVHA